MRASATRRGIASGIGAVTVTTACTWWPSTTFFRESVTRADDTNPDGACTRRDYTFDNNTNRTALATGTADVGAACTSTGATTTSYSYDSADRLQTTGTVYDAFGRTTTQTSGATIGYYANDLVRQQTSGTSRQT